MRQRQEGAIVLISSAAGVRGIHTHTAYQVVKGALAAIRARPGPRVRPGPYPGQLCRARRDPHGVPRRHDARSEEAQLENRIPLRAEGKADQVAELIVQLITNDYITGETVAIDGGLTMRIA